MQASTVRVEGGRLNERTDASADFADRIPMEEEEEEEEVFDSGGAAD